MGQQDYLKLPEIVNNEFDETNAITGVDTCDKVIQHEQWANAVHTVCRVDGISQKA